MSWNTLVAPSASDLLGVSVASDDSGWIVAQSGALIRRVAGNWTLLTPNPLLTRPNYDVWNFGNAAAVMVGGNSRPVRSKWNGTLLTWTDTLDDLLPSPRSMAAITLPIPMAVAVGQGSDGNSYSISSDLSTLGPRLQIGGAGWQVNGLWVDPSPSGSRLAWAVGKGGLAYSLNLGLWSSAPTGATEDLVGVCGVSSSAVWAAGSDAAGQKGRVISFNGISWSIPASNTFTANPIFAIACANGQGYAVGKDMQVFDCTSASCIANASITGVPGHTAYAIWITPSASGGSDIWVAGTGGTIYRHQTGGGARIQPATGTTKTLRNIFGKNNSDFYVTGDGGTIL
jgi:hypothetical protein